MSGQESVIWLRLFFKGFYYVLLAFILNARHAQVDRSVDQVIGVLLLDKVSVTATV